MILVLIIKFINHLQPHSLYNCQSTCKKTFQQEVINKLGLFWELVNDVSTTELKRKSWWINDVM